MASPLKTLRTERFQLILRVALLVAVIFGFSFSTFTSIWFGAPVILFVLVIIITLGLVKRVEKSNRDFAQFLNNINHDDFTSSSGSESQGFGAKDFVLAQKSLLSKYKELKADRTAQYEYLKMVVEHVDMALICFDDQGKVEIINGRANLLLGKKHIGQLSTISELNPELATAITSIHAGESKMVKMILNNELLNLVLSASEFILLEKKFKLVSLQNIKQVLDESEIESWQKLIKVLTHEIMNSMTPIVSLSHYVNEVVNDKDSLAQLSQQHSEQHQDFQRSITAIASRGQGLMEFVDSYRSLSNLPDPQLEQVDIEKLFQRVKLLLSARFSDANMKLIISSPKTKPILIADDKQLEQILINLLSNAIHAVEGQLKPLVELSCLVSESGKTMIQVTDNGCGIDASIVDNIFTPFYTTKEAGNGIGLSISRQLARLNNGSLSVSSLKNEGTQFTLSF